jgi:putative SOS response-associated peptidase YedK
VRPVPENNAEEEIARQYHIPIPPQFDLPISYNIAPTQNVLAIRRNPETGERTLDALRWGLMRMAVITQCPDTKT